MSNYPSANTDRNFTLLAASVFSHLKRFETYGHYPFSWTIRMRVKEIRQEYRYSKSKEDCESLIMDVSDLRQELIDIYKVIIGIVDRSEL